MSLKTKLLELFKYEPDKDGAQTFNIKSALNDNWDKIEAWAQSVKTALAKLVPTSRTVNGKTLTKDVTLTGENIAVSTTDSTPISGAVKYRTNPNLLDNWYFGRPVNQRGQTEHSGAAAEYFIDRWRCGGYTQTIRVTNDGLVWDTDTGVWLTQKIEDEATLMGKTCTLSAIVNGELYSVTGKYGEGNTSIVVAPNVYYEMNHDNGGVRFVSYTTSNAGNITLLAAKLELGDTQTLAHKENGVWVLNEIPDFGEQLRRCQYYAFKPVNVKDYGRIASGIGMSGNFIAFNIPIPHMRNVAPVVTGIGNTCTFWDGMSIQSGTISSFNGTSNEYITLFVSSTSFSVTAGTPFHLLTADILISADL